MKHIDQFSEKEKQLIRDKAVTAKTGKPAHSIDASRQDKSRSSRVLIVSE